MGLLKGKSTRSVWRVQDIDHFEMARRLWHRIYEDELLGRAAELAYFFLFSIFPLLLFLTTLLGYLARENWQLGRELFSFVSTVSPSREVTSLLRDTLSEITLGRSGGKLWLGLGIALLASSNGVIAVGRTLNTAYELRETRPWWRRRLEAVALITVFAVLIVIALVLIFFGESIAESTATSLELGPFFAPVWTLVQWVAVVFLAVVSFDMIFNFAPDTHGDDRVWFTPGAVTGVLLWVLASSGFQLYLAQFGYYSRTYGSLGAVIVMLLWFYFTGAAILIGGQVNSEVAKMQNEGAEARRGAANGEEVKEEEGATGAEPAAEMEVGSSEATP